MGWMADETGLGKRRANFVPLTVLSHLRRAADVFPDHPAVIDRDRSWTYREFHDRVTRQAAFLAARGIRSVAAEGFQAPGVVVSYTSDPEVKTGRAFAAQGTQIAAGVPLAIEEGADFSTFRIGLFGLDKLKDVEGTVARLTAVFDKVL